jgi:diguanylate cyclase (GGDEF)-like protein
MLEPFSVFDYEVSSAHDVDTLLDVIAPQMQKHVLAHVSSYLHNTVMVQTLVQKFSKKFPDAEVILLSAERDEGTRLTVYTCEDPCLHEHDHGGLSNRALAVYRNANEKLSTDLQTCQQQVIRRHFVDPLTNLPNLYQLRNDLHDNEECTFVVINIDNFKLINDFYGFIVGDYILEQTSMKIVEFTGGPQVYRMYGDEFAVLLDKRLEFYELKEYLNDLHETLKGLSFEYHGTTIYVDTTLASSASGNPHNMFSKVGMALKYAKEMQLPFWIYEDRMHFEHEYESNLKIALKVRKAIETSGIVPYYQPIVCNKTGEIVKYECLSRLVDERGNILPPKMFIDIAKTIKVYNQVTMSIIDQAFEVFKNNDYGFSVNLSIEDIMSHEIYDFIIDKLKTYNFGKRVTFELLESESIEDFKKVSRFITEIKRHGAQVAIDDFGSGFSNFSYLAEIDVDYIKIDGSLIANIDKNANSRLISETIVSFAKGMGIETIAEYVHSSTVLSTVKQLGIDYSQGYHIDEPHPQILGDK